MAQLNISIVAHTQQRVLSHESSECCYIPILITRIDQLIGTDFAAGLSEQNKHSYIPNLVLKNWLVL